MKSGAAKVLERLLECRSRPASASLPPRAAVSLSVQAAFGGHLRSKYQAGQRAPPSRIPSVYRHCGDAMMGRSKMRGASHPCPALLVSARPTLL